MKVMDGMLRLFTVFALTSLFLGGATADAFEAHNFIEPPFGSFKAIGALAIDQANGNVYVAEDQYESGEVKVFGAEGGGPAGGVPSSFTGAASFEGSFAPSGVAVDSASGVVYVGDGHHYVVDVYKVNGSNADEYVCEFKYYGVGDRCLADGGEEAESTTPVGTAFESPKVALDSMGDVYIGGRIGYSEAGIFEFNAAGEAVHTYPLPEAGGGNAYVESIAVSSSGTIYVQLYRGVQQTTEVLELKRSSLTGAVEGAPAAIPDVQKPSGIALDQTSGQLFIDLGTHGEALDAAHEVVSRFGTGVIAEGGALAVDESTGEVYVANGGGQNVDRFGPGVSATLPFVDEPPPSTADVTRTSALLSGTVLTGDATSTWQLEYVAASEYEPAAANPYAGGGSTAIAKLAAATTGTAVGPVPLTGLLAGTTYHYRLVARNELGTTYGEDHTFTTAAAEPPIVRTGAANGVTQTGVTLTGTVDTRELQTSYEFEVGTDTGYGGAELFGNVGSSGVEAVSADLQFLIPGVTYHYRLVASNADGTSYGQDMTFATPGVQAAIAQPPATALVASPTVTFPSVAGAITKPQASGKRSKKAKPKKRARGSKGKRTTRKRRAKHGGAKRR